MGYPLSDPPAEDEVDGLSSRVSRGVWVSYEDDAIQLLVCGPSGESLVRYAVRPEEGKTWSELPIVDAIAEFAGSLAQLIALLGEHNAPQGIVDRLDEHARDVCRHHQGVQITRIKTLSLDISDWLD